MLKSIIATLPSRSSKPFKASLTTLVFKTLLVLFLLYCVFFVACDVEGTRECSIRPVLVQAKEGWMTFQNAHLIPAWKSTQTTVVQPLLQHTQEGVAMMTQKSQQLLDETLKEYPETLSLINSYTTQLTILAGLIWAEGALALAHLRDALLVPAWVQLSTRWHKAAVYFVDDTLPFIIQQSRDMVKWSLSRGIPMIRDVLLYVMGTLKGTWDWAAPQLRQGLDEGWVVVKRTFQDAQATIKATPTYQAVEVQVLNVVKVILAHPMTQQVLASPTTHLLTRSLAQGWAGVQAYCATGLALWWKGVQVLQVWLESLTWEQVISEAEGSLKTLEGLWSEIVKKLST